MLDGGGSYVALVSPDGNDLTIVVETMVCRYSGYFFFVDLTIVVETGMLLLSCFF